jgi:hypothetical protein
MCLSRRGVLSVVPSRCSACSRPLPVTLSKNVKRSSCGFPIVSCSCGRLYTYDSEYPYRDPASFLYHTYRVGRSSSAWIECAAILDTTPVQLGLFSRVRSLCYQCLKPSEWLAPDGRCSSCTRCTLSEIVGGDV